MQVESLFEQLLFTTVFIETEYSDGSTGTGTGFIYSVDVAPGRASQFVVTNKHVVENGTSVSLRFIRSENADMTTPLLGQVLTMKISADLDNLFVGHPDPDIDVSVSSISRWFELFRSQNAHPFFRAVTPSIMMNEESGQALDALEQVTFIGYPNGLYDQVNYLPLARRGATATPPTVDYGGKPIFLIDGSVFPGSSGSPVFIADTGGFASRDGEFQIGSRVMLLGIVAAVYQRPVPVLELPTATKSFVEDALDIGIVYKAKTIDECVDKILADAGLERFAGNEQPPVEKPPAEGDPLNP
jgi:Trypsin-like peptidase domain